MDEKHAGWRKWVRSDLALTLVAVAAGGGGAWLASQYLATRAAAAAAKLEQRYQPRSVVVASTGMPRGEILSSANLAVRSIPRDFIPADAVTADDAAALLGQRLAVPVSQGTPITAGAVSAPAAAGLSSVLGASERALTLAVDSLNSQANGLRAGDYVDLFYGRRENGDELLVPLLQRVELLAVGESFVESQAGGAVRDFATVTLRVRATDAPRILLAQQAGDVSLLLRARSDDMSLPDRPWRGRELLRAGTVPPAVVGIEVLTGGNGGLAPTRTWIRVGSQLRGDAT